MSGNFLRNQSAPDAIYLKRQEEHCGRAEIMSIGLGGRQPSEMIKYVSFCMCRRFPCRSRRSV